MASRYYLLKPCRTTPAYISTPKAALHLDLADARAKLEGAGFPTEDVQVMLIVGGEPEATLYAGGEGARGPGARGGEGAGAPERRRPRARPRRLYLRGSRAPGARRGVLRAFSRPAPCRDVEYALDASAI